ncbi:hypothetical protein [Candidatus Thiodubiliella endoseptemdiera]|uniref:hypothetical protein n=1 Tax=Candidatus Thiodubiliella endoseptemdiera TaxID=2738886 RepID=UPI0034DF89A5
MKKMIYIKQQPSVFCDSFVANDAGILFASFWGRTTSLQQFLARMEIPTHEGGINELTFEISKDESSTFFLQNTKNMQKLSGRVSGTIYGKDLSHIFIYDKSTVKIDYSSYKATILYFDDTQIDNSSIWKLLKELSPIPLLDIWMSQIIRVCHQDGYINNIDGFGGVSALIVELFEIDFEESISRMIKDQTLLVA